MEIIRELDKESLIYSYTIYTTITSSTPNYIYHLGVHYTIITRYTCCSHVLNIIVLVFSTIRFMILHHMTAIICLFIVQEIK